MEVLTMLWTMVKTWCCWLNAALDEADPEWHGEVAERHAHVERETLLHMRDAALAVAARIPADATDDFYAGYQTAIRATMEAIDAHLVRAVPRA